MDMDTWLFQHNVFPFSHGSWVMKLYVVILIPHLSGSDSLTDTQPWSLPVCQYISLTLPLCGPSNSYHWALYYSLHIVTCISLGLRIWSLNQCFFSLLVNFGFLLDLFIWDFDCFFVKYFILVVLSYLVSVRVDKPFALRTNKVFVMIKRTKVFVGLFMCFFGDLLTGTCLYAH